MYGELLRPKEAEVVPSGSRGRKKSTNSLNNRNLYSYKMVEAAGIEPTSHRRRIMHPCCKCIAIQCVPRIPRTAPLQVDCKRIALLCKKTMPYLCQTIWLPSSLSGPGYRTIRRSRSWLSSEDESLKTREFYHTVGRGWSSVLWIFPFMSIPP